MGLSLRILEDGHLLQVVVGFVNFVYLQQSTDSQGLQVSALRQVLHLLVRHRSTYKLISKLFDYTVYSSSTHSTIHAALSYYSHWQPGTATSSQ